MRTTLTLDDDVAAKLKAEARRSGKSFKETVNELLRSAILGRRRAPTTEPYRVRTRDLGRLRPGIGLDDVEGLLEQIEGPVRR